MEVASRAAWIATKESINSKDVSRKVASGGNRRSERAKTQEHSRFTPTLAFLGRQPVRNFHASLESQTLAGDALFGSPGKANPLQTDISRDVWTRLSKPLLSSTRLNKSGKSSSPEINCMTLYLSTSIVSAYKSVTACVQYKAGWRGKMQGENRSSRGEM
jgi:hypothetical protein